MQAFPAVIDTIQKDFDTQQIPPPLHEVIELFRKVHVYHRTFKQAQLLNEAAKNPSQGNPAVYGAALQLAGDYTEIGSYTITVALVTKCTHDLLQEYRQLNIDCKILDDVWNWRYPIYQPIAWKRGTENPMFLSPCFSLLSRIQALKLINQIFSITSCALRVFWQSFRISMCLCDAYLMLHGDPQARYEACTELVAKWGTYYHQLQEEQNRFLEKIKRADRQKETMQLLDEIEHHRDLTDDILRCMKQTEDSSSLIQKIKVKFKQNIAKVAQQAKEEAEDLYDAAERAMDAIYVKGKMIPLQINLAEGKAAPPLIPLGRFPPWGGQKVALIVPKADDQPVEAVKNFILDNMKLPFEDSFKGVVWLADQLNRLYKNQLQPTPISPFA